MSNLRAEIIQAEAHRSELLKWKLLIAAALGAAGLGLSPLTPRSSTYLVLCLIPFASFYVDLLCAHLHLRIMVIAHYLRSSGDNEGAAYESFVDRTRRMGDSKLNVFALEDWALESSPYALSALTGIAGVVILLEAPLKISLLGWVKPETAPAMRLAVVFLFVASGVAGFLLTGAMKRRHAKRIKGLEQLKGGS